MINGIIKKQHLAQIIANIENEHTITYNYLIEKNIIHKRPQIDKKWMDSVYNRFLLHKISDTQGIFTNLLPMETETLVFDNQKIDVILSSSNLESLFHFVFHPDYDNAGGLKIGFHNENEKVTFLKNLNDALALIKKVDKEAFKMIKSTVKCVCPVYTFNPLKRGDVISFNADYVIGLIIYSPCPTILTAETIIHETRHNVLNSYLKLDKYFLDNNIVTITPLRKDPRPLLGLLHQSYVLCGLVKFYNALLSFDHYLDMDNVKKRYNVHYFDCLNTLNILKENKKYFTKSGLYLFQNLTEEFNNYGKLF